MLICFVPLISRKRLAHAIAKASAACAGLARDITNTDRQTLTGSVHGCVFATFKFFSFLFFFRQIKVRKLTGKVL